MRWLLFLALLQIPMGGSTGHQVGLPTLTLVHHNAFNVNCTTTTCPTSTVSSTGAGNAAVIVFGGIVQTGPAATNINAITSLTCNPPGWQISATLQSYDAGTAATSVAYCLSLLGGQTTLGITLTNASTQAGDLFYREYHTTGTGWSVETLASPQLITACTTCTGSAISLVGLNDVVISAGTPAHTITAMAAPYSNVDIGAAESAAIGDHFPTTSGAIGSFTQNTSGTLYITTIAIYDNN